MKKDHDLKFILAAFIAVILSLFIGTKSHAQEQIISDTTYVLQRNDTLFQVKTVQYNTGKKTIDETPIGRDTATALIEVRQQAYNISQQFAAAVWIAENERSFRRTISGYSSSIQAIVGRTFQQDLDNIGLGQAIMGTYNLRVNGTTLPATIIRNQSGSLRMRVNGTNYTIELYSELLIRIRNFDDANAKVDFYLVRSSANSARWIGGNSRYVLIKTNNR